MAETFTLGMVEGQGTLRLRDAEPYALANPTSISGSIDVSDEESFGTGAITAGTFSTPKVRLRQDITTPVPASVFIEATFTPTAPGNLSGAINDEGFLTASTSLGVELDIEVRQPGGGSLILPPTVCRAQPVNLSFETVTPYDEATRRITIEDADFTVPQVAAEASCDPLIRGKVNEQLAGSGHALRLTLEGDLELPPPPGDPSATTLVVSPEGGSTLGTPVTLSATVAPGPDAEIADVPTGLVDFYDGTVRIGTEELDAGVAELTTAALTGGTRSLTARYRGDPLYAPSASGVVLHTVSTSPTISADVPASLQVGGSPVDFEVEIDSAGFGVPVTGARLEVTITRAAGSSSLGSVGGQPRFLLSRIDGEAAEAIPLGETGPAQLDAVVLDGIDLLPGGRLSESLRIQATGVGTPSPTACTAANTTCPGPLHITFRLVQPGDSPTELASGTAITELVEAERRPSTLAPILPTGRPVEPNNIVRQGSTVALNQYTLGPVVNGRRPTGEVEMLIDGRRVPSRLGLTPLAEGYQPRVTTGNGGVSIQAVVPLDMPTGVRTVTVRYLGNATFLPVSRSVTIEVLPAMGASYDCTNSSISDRRSSLNVQVSAVLPAVAPAGSTVPIRNLDLQMLSDRGLSVGLFNGLGAGADVGSGNLTEVKLGFGPTGEGTASGVGRVNGTVMASPDAANPDQVMRVFGGTGAVVVAGAPGEVVPVTLESIQMTFDAGIPFVVTCSSLGGTPEVLGEVTLAGTTLTAEPAGPVRAGDEVTLTADVVPATSTGYVELLDVTDPEAPVTVGFAGVREGTASVVVSFEQGDRVLRARYFGSVALPNTTSADVPLVVLGALRCVPFAEEGSAAVVRLVYLELLGRCPDQAGFHHWKGRLDAGTSPEAFARAIARTPEAVGKVVDDAYDTMLGRAADPAGRAFWVGRLQVNGRYDSLLADLGASGELWAQAGSTNTGFVTRVYDRLLDRTPDAAGLDHWVGRLEAGTSRRTLVRTIATLSEPLGRLVAASYDEILGRAPTTAERTDGIAHLRSTGDRSGLYAQLIGTPEFTTRAQGFPNPED